MGRKKALIIILAVLIGLPVAELVGEVIDYQIVSRNTKTAYERSEIGLTKEAVKSQTGEPDYATAANGQETWHWDAGNSQGILWKWLTLTTVKGHYALAITFDENGKVVHRSGGIN